MTDTISGPPRLFRFGIVTPFLSDLPTWREQVRRIADHGYSTVLMPDFPQLQPSPAPALAVAATVADVRVGTWVYAAPFRAPWLTAWEAHSLTVLTQGRFEMGIGVGRPGIEEPPLRLERASSRPRAFHVEALTSAPAAACLVTRAL